MYGAVPPRTASAATISRPNTWDLLGFRNRRAIVDQVSPGGGKLRTLTVKGWQSICPDAVLENQPNPNCAAEGSLNQFFQNYTIDTAAQVVTVLHISHRGDAYR